MSSVAQAIGRVKAFLPERARNLKEFFEIVGVQFDPQQGSTDHVNSCLAHYLSECLMEALKDVEAFLRVDDVAPDGLSSLVSIRNLRVVYTLMEVLWLIGLRTTITLRSGVIERDLSFPTSMVLQQEVLSGLRQCSLQLSLANVFELVRSMDFIIHHPRFTAFLVNRHMERVLLSYFVLLLEWDGADDRESEIAVVRGRLHDILVSAPLPLKSLGISKLRMFTSGNKSIRGISSEYITIVLLSGDGLHAVMKGFLEDFLDTQHCAQMQLQLAKSLSILPKRSTEGTYLSQLFPQVLRVWAVAERENDQISLRVLALLVARCSQKYSSELLVSHFFRPFLRPLLCLFTGERYTNDSTIAIGSILVTRDCVTSALKSLEKLLQFAPPISEMGNALISVRVDCILYHLYDSTTRAAEVKKHAALLQWTEMLIMQMFSFAPDMLPPSVARVLLNNHQQDSEMRGMFALCGDCSVEIRVAESASSLSSPIRFSSTLSALSESSDLDSLLQQSSAGKRLRALIGLVRNIDSLHTDDEKPAKESSNKLTFRGCLSQLFLLLLRELFASAESESDDNTSERLTVTTTAVQYILMSTPMEVILVDGASILTLLSTILEVLLMSFSIVANIVLDGTMYIQSNAMQDTRDPTPAPPVAKPRSERIQVLSSTSSTDVEEKEEVSVDSNSKSTLEIALNILSSLLLFGERRRSSSEEEALQSLVPTLQHIAREHANSAVAQQAADLSLTIFRRRTTYSSSASPAMASASQVDETLDKLASPQNQESAACRSETSTLLTSFGTVVKDSRSPPPDRAFSFRELGLLVDAMTKGEVFAHFQELLKLFLNGVVDTDSFVYLNASLSLHRMARRLAHPDLRAQSRILLATLVATIAEDRAMFTSVFGDIAQEVTGKISWDVILSIQANTDNPQRCCVAMADVLVQCIQRKLFFTAGIAEQSLLLGLVAICLRRLRLNGSSMHSQADPSVVALSEAYDVFSGRRREATEATSAPVDLFESADSLYLRQSIMSLLAEVLPFIGHRGEGFMVDVLSIAVQTLRLRTGPEADATALRRSAVFVVRFAVEHNVENLVTSSTAQYLTEVISALEFVLNNERDKVVLFQAEQSVIVLHNILSERIGLTKLA